LNHGSSISVATRGGVLDELVTQGIASLWTKELVSVIRVSQDGLRGASSAGVRQFFQREERLQKLLGESEAARGELRRRQLENPESSAGLSIKQRAARRRAAKEKHNDWSRRSRSCRS